MPRAGLQLGLERNISVCLRQTHGQAVDRASYGLCGPKSLGGEAGLGIGGYPGVQEDAGLPIREWWTPDWTRQMDASGLPGAVDLGEHLCPWPGLGRGGIDQVGHRLGDVVRIDRQRAVGAAPGDDAGGGRSGRTAERECREC